LDPYSFTLQNAQLSRPRLYDDNLQHFDVQPPENAPKWSCVSQTNHAAVYDTDFVADTDITSGMSGYESEGTYESQIMYGTDEEYEKGESSTIGMIRGALAKEDKNKKKKKKGKGKDVCI
jgi:hypothetical protein